MRRSAHPRATTIAAVSIALVVGLGLTACASTNDESDAMHASVVRVSERAATADYAGALAELDRLEADVDDAVAAGGLDAAQEAQIRDSIALVRADLETAQVAATPTPTPTPTTDDSEDSGDDSPGNSGSNKDKKKDDKGKGKGDD